MCWWWLCVVVVVVCGGSGARRCVWWWWVDVLVVVVYMWWWQLHVVVVVVRGILHGSCMHVMVPVASHCGRLSGWWWWWWNAICTYKCTHSRHAYGHRCHRHTGTNLHTYMHTHAYSVEKHIQQIYIRNTQHAGSDTHTQYSSWCFTSGCWCTVWPKCILFTFQHTPATPIYVCI